MNTNVQTQCQMVARQVNKFNIRSTGELNLPSLYFKMVSMLVQDILDYTPHGKFKFITINASISFKVQITRRIFHLAYMVFNLLSSRDSQIHGGLIHSI